MVHCSCFCDTNWNMTIVVMCTSFSEEKPSISFTLGQREEVESEMIPSLLPICESAAIGVVLMISESAATQFLSPISVSAASQSRCWIVLSTTNQFSLSNSGVCGESVFDVELCRPRRISFLYRNGVVCSESGFRCRIVLPVAKQVFAAELVLSAAKQVFAAELCCP
jgi:hypothetical protein